MPDDHADNLEFSSPADRTKGTPAMAKTARMGDQMLAGIAIVMVFGVGGYLGYIFFGSIHW